MASIRDDDDMASIRDEEESSFCSEENEEEEEDDDEEMLEGIDDDHYAIAFQDSCYPEKIIKTFKSGTLVYLRLFEGSILPDFEFTMVEEFNKFSTMGHGSI